MTFITQEYSLPILILIVTINFLKYGGAEMLMKSAFFSSTSAKYLYQIIVSKFNIYLN